MNRGILIKSLNPWLTRISDLLAFLAVFGTGEIAIEFLFPLSCFAVGSFVLSKLRDPTRQQVSPVVVISILAAFVGAALFLIFRIHWHPLIVATYLSMSVHALIWLVRDESRVEAMRLFLGLVEVAVAAVLTPDLYIAFVIFAFMISASLKISALFLAGEFERFDSEFKNRPLPPAFIINSLGTSFLVFICSLVIFPILPRAHSEISGGWSPEKRQRGYTEQVNLGMIPQWGNGSGENQIVVRVFLPPGADKENWQKEIPHGLIRGRVLDRFDGSKWIASGRSSRKSDSTVTAAKIERTFPTEKIEIIREPIDTEILPIPYGAKSVELTSANGDWVTHKLGAGMWYVPSGDRRRFQYFVQSVNKPIHSDIPVEEHREIPSEWIGRSERWLSLSKELFRSESTAEGKINSVMNYLSSGRFKLALSTAMNSARLSPELKKMLQDPRRQLDMFLFTDQRGHCEYFASAAAFLLRLGKVPTRLVAGFRISMPPIGGVITAKQEDAHAWLEAWDPKKGWIVLDPTPMQLRPSRGFISEWVSTAQDFLSAYWYRNILGFDQDTHRQKSLWLAKEFANKIRGFDAVGTFWKADNFGLILIVPLLILFGIGIFWWLRRKSANSGQDFEGGGHSKIPWSLRWRRASAQFWLKRKKGLNLRLIPQAQVSPEIRMWYQIQARLRFGPVTQGSSEWKAELKRMDRLRALWF